ncbi:gamma-aminobutyric acid receptor subunit alpha-1 isoform X1 [Neodiprion lecontei]|uniref:Gamma-aminobutyric acid receptor subunit alpha-1 isoform X1 n=1 Tax=Neodiprion lecontei TaxID=441921 RepID=A0A6J0BJT7_NEOLC|nr:gamma-aminobutyric acid receptor subunit alpha-1 isoform X1 [Neodiprion lecontei]
MKMIIMIWHGNMLTILILLVVSFSSIWCRNDPTGIVDLGSLDPPNTSSLSAITSLSSLSLNGMYWDPISKNNNNVIKQSIDTRIAVKTVLPVAVKEGRSAVNDMVSKNITMVLENLLKNYENNQLPTHGKGMPTVVKTNILIRSMGPISELDMDYSMDCYFRQYWRDSRLSFLGPIKSLSLSIKMLERIWRPDTYFYNGKHSYVHTITVPNKLLRISQDGDILYSMRLTIKAKCPMELRNFPMDRQSCPLILGSYAYTSRQLIYEWQQGASVNFVPGMTLSQFDLMGSPYRNLTFTRNEGDFSVLQVSFNLQRHTGYFLIQVYVPCVLIVVLSWVSFWIHREATSDRVGLGITTVLTLSTISLDSRTDLPKVKYATALDWFLLMSFFYCIATLLEFAGVHYFTKVGSGEFSVDEEDNWDDDFEEPIGTLASVPRSLRMNHRLTSKRRSSLICPISNGTLGSATSLGIRSPQDAPNVTSMERQTQTERTLPKWRQFLYCLAGDDGYRRQRQREATAGICGRLGQSVNRHVNSVSYIDRAARICFPASFGLLNVCYWMLYVTWQDEFKWQDPPIAFFSH